MKKSLSIIIPRYNETEKDVFPLLASIAGQAGVDFSDIEVIIANDGGGAGALGKDFLGLFGLCIRQVSLEKNMGPGMARQAGLDAARGQYAMFCDADDTLHNVGVLGALMQEAERSAPDILSSSWLEEVLDGEGRFRYIAHEGESTWMHGKLLRRAFLAQNGIRFRPDLRVHEDSYFLCLAASLAQRALRIPVTTYVWKYRPGSITRRDGASYTYSSIPEFIRACSLAHRELEGRVPGQMPQKVAQFVLYCYFSLHQPGWQEPGNAGYLAAAEAAFAKHIAPMWHYWEGAPPEAIAQAYNGERMKSFAGGVERETVFEWARRLGLGAGEKK